jgi:hypothetical protein
MTVGGWVGRWVGGWGVGGWVGWEWVGEWVDWGGFDVSVCLSLCVCNAASVVRCVCLYACVMASSVVSRYTPSWITIRCINVGERV